MGIIILPAKVGKTLRGGAFIVFLLVVLSSFAATAYAADVDIDSTNFPDSNFRAIVEGKDTNSDNILSESEAQSVTSFNLMNKNISSLQGIEYFTNIESLFCSRNPLSELDVSSLSKLKSLACANAGITSLDVSSNVGLKYLTCDNNNLAALDVSYNVELIDLYCNDNNIEELDLSNNTKLLGLTCSDNNLTKLDVSNKPALEELRCENNKITSLIVENNSNLHTLNCANNEIDELDVSKNPLLKYIYCGGNKLIEIDLSQNPNLLTFSGANQNPVVYASHEEDGTYASDSLYFSDLGLSGVVYQTGDRIITPSLQEAPGFMGGTNHLQHLLSGTITFDIHSYTVIFNDWDGSKLKEIVVESGLPAASSAPLPIRVGWTFVGWDSDITRILEDITVSAQYEMVPFASWFEPEATYVRGSLAPLVFIVDKDISFYLSISIDGEDAGKVTTIAAGSTKATISPEYLESLSSGSHAIEVFFIDGTSAVGNFRVVDAPLVKNDTESPSPTPVDLPTDQVDKPQRLSKVGDSSPLLLSLTILLASGVALMASRKRIYR